jgi:aspartate aminotransferase-like enzyme
VTSGQGPLLLMTPGPTRVPDRVLAAGALPMIHHRTDEFSREVGSVVSGLGPLFGTASPVLPVHATGRGGTEAAIANLFSAGDEIAACCNGKFGAMWAAHAEAYGLTVHRMATDWSQDIDADELDRLLTRHPAVRAVTVTCTDTSTGVCNDVAAVARIGRAHGALVMVDGVSAVGGTPFAFDEWGVDVAVTASQKCLMSAPGLAFVALSERAWAAHERSRLPRRYWDFSEIRRSVTAARPNTPGTPPVTVMRQVAEAIRMINDEGLDVVWARHEAMAQAVRRATARLGLSLQATGLRRFAPTVTAIAAPPGISPETIRDGLKARGILVAGGLGTFEATCFRVGHMGDIRMVDVDATMTALADILGGLGTGRPASAEPAAR